jgi:hypothetical protein
MVSNDELVRKWWTVFIAQGPNVETEDVIMAQLRGLVVGVPLWQSGFDPRSGRVGIVVDAVPTPPTAPHPAMQAVESRCYITNLRIIDKARNARDGVHAETIFRSFGQCQRYGQVCLVE